MSEPSKGNDQGAAAPVELPVSGEVETQHQDFHLYSVQGPDPEPELIAVPQNTQKMVELFLTHDPHRPVPIFDGDEIAEMASTSQDRASWLIQQEARAPSQPADLQDIYAVSPYQAPAELKQYQRLSISEKQEAYRTGLKETDGLKAIKDVAYQKIRQDAENGFLDAMSSTVNTGADPGKDSGKGVKPGMLGIYLGFSVACVLLIFAVIQTLKQA